jgi:hypothetical protein
MRGFKFTTTGIIDIVKFEELGAYFTHPTNNYILSDYFDLDEIINSTTIQSSIDDGHIIATDLFNTVILDVKTFYVTPIFDIDNISKTLSYIGYGEPNNCKILKINTLINNYSALWSEGVQIMDKKWSDRLIYNYF